MRRRQLGGNGTASDWADAAVGFEEWDDTGEGECVEGGRVDSCGGEVGENFGEGVEGVGVGGDDAVVFVTFAGRTGAAVFRSVSECAPNVSGHFFGHVGGDGGVGWFGDGWAVVVVFEELWELGLDLWLCRELWWALEDFEGLGKFVVVEALHDGGNVLFLSLVRVVFVLSLSWLGCGLCGCIVVRVEELVELCGVDALDVGAHGFGMRVVSLVAASGSVFRGVVEGHSWDGEEKFPSVGGLFVVVVVGVVDDVVADLFEEVGVECATLGRDGFGCGCVGQDVVP